MHSISPLRIATRQSPLALWQANYVKEQLQCAYPDLEINILGMTTEGDRHLETRLQKIGGKGLFIKELEHALLQDQADIAVHSLKDLTVDFPVGLGLAAVCKREDPRDVFVSNIAKTIEDLPSGSVIGTSSLRREGQLRALRNDLIITPLRGNVQSRLAKLDQGQFAGIVLAAAGLQRLGLQSRISSYFSIETCLPAVGQGVLAIECRTSNKKLQELLHVLHDQNTFDCITAERAINQRLGGGCHLPLAAHARINADQLELQAWIGDLKNRTALTASVTGERDQAEQLGFYVAENLLAQGANVILANE